MALKYGDPIIHNNYNTKQNVTMKELIINTKAKPSDYNLKDHDIPEGYDFYGSGDNSPMPLSGYEIRYLDPTGWRHIDVYCPRKFKPSDIYIYKKNKGTQDTTPIACSIQKQTTSKQKKQ